MLRRKARQEKSVPEWKRQLQEAAEAVDPAELGDASAVQLEIEPAASPPRSPLPGGDEKAEPPAPADESDEDDEGFDPSNYDLDVHPAESPPPRSPQEPSHACRVAVANLPFESTREALASFLAACGAIEQIEMPDLSLSKRTAIVSFANELSAQAALRLSGKSLPIVRPGQQVRPLTILLAPVGATPQDDGLRYDLLRNHITYRAGRAPPSPAGLSANIGCSGANRTEGTDTSAKRIRTEQS
ncbi:hypothetical protein AB1Y20_006644 [Prymnesium parvum]|uniref:RRM domain-containing protein n=1 Tax=Prymnesium parvum TaxID=97485 RepID=A0AB34IYZ3_PRYPA